MKIEPFSTSRLRNDAHFQFYTEFSTLMNRTGAANLNIEQLYATFITLFADEDTALKKINKSAITAEIQEADKYRDQLFSGMTDANKTALKHFTPEVREAAKRLKIVFDTYGNLARKPLDEETSAIYNILQDLNGRYAEDAATVGLPPWVNELAAANDEFGRLMRDRYDETAMKTDLVLKQVRVKIDEAYRAIVERINAAIVLNGEEPYREFVATLNAVIKRYEDIVAQRAGRKKN